jgi:hypothetical protein
MPPARHNTLALLRSSDAALSKKSAMTGAMGECSATRASLCPGACSGRQRGPWTTAAVHYRQFPVLNS